NDHVLVDLLGADIGRKGAERQGAGHGEDGALLGEGVSHGVLSMTALLCLGKLVEGHLHSVGASPCAVCVVAYSFIRPVADKGSTITRWRRTSAPPRTLRGKTVCSPQCPRPITTRSRRASST